MPHYGHILVSVIKDVVARYKTMRGYRVERRVGWDCHGLPVETLIEKELGIKNKRAIETLEQNYFSSVKKFNAACQRAVFRCVDKWKYTLSRIGRWADYSNQYTTMNNSYIESVWWVFKSLYNNGLIYKDYRVNPYCPRCGTCLSNFEVNLGYKEVEDQSIYVKFLLTNSDLIIEQLVGEKINKATYFLAWTTTPWTLPGNVALAINSSLDYAIIENDVERLILAKDRLSVVNKLDYKIVKIVNGKELLGLEYKPLYNTITLQQFAEIEDQSSQQFVHKILAGNFVTTNDGTGIVHIAPCFGEDDMRLSRQYKLPVLITVDLEGCIIKNCNIPGEGEKVKDADFFIKTDLLNRNLLWKEESITHTYPFCWRCDHYLIYYSLSAWYVGVTKIKKDLIKNNQKINWLPKHIKNGRFGNWIASARDWGISRSRFWGAPIPVWICKKCKNKKIIGSAAELITELPTGNKFFVVRHGEAEHNVNQICNSNPKKIIHLTKTGKKQASQLAKEIKDKQIDIIITSQLTRAKETATIVNQYHELKIITDARFNEIGFGTLEGKSYSIYTEMRNKIKNRDRFSPKEGESFIDVKKRVKLALSDLDKTYKNKNILIITHQDVVRAIHAYFSFKTDTEIAKAEIPLGSLHVFSKKITDLHRPFVDEIIFRCPCGGEKKRVEDVLDCWFESGSMPYASWHYPYENRALVEKTFPADFIAEAMDQTRGWFYTLHVLASALTSEKTKLIKAQLGKSQPAFKNVLANGLILASDGKKLSKKLKNYTDPEELLEKYGADSMRYFLLTASPIGEDYRFSDKGVEEVLKKVIMLIWNVFTFYEMHSSKKNNKNDQIIIKPKHVLDKWIISLLHILIKDTTANMDKYELVNGTRLIGEFINELSTWYLRRSRDRLRGGEGILGHILLNISLLLAPSMPFLAEVLYKKLSKNCESVHLENWPSYNQKLIDYNLLKHMDTVREIVTIGHDLRNKSLIKIRQPLQKLQITRQELKNKIDFLDLLKEELNVKEIVFGSEYKLDTEITSELKAEGLLRECVRQLNNYRKEKGLTIKNKITIHYYTDSAELTQIFEKFNNNLKKEIICKDIIRNTNIDNYDVVVIDAFTIKLKII